MPVNSISDIRKSWGGEWSQASDEEVLGAYAKAVKMDPTDVANRLGYDPSSGSLTAQRLGGGLDSYQSQLFGAGEAVAKSLGLPSGVTDYLGRKREDNKLAADIAGGRAQQLGGIDDFRKVTGPISGLNFAGGLLAGSLPQMAATATGAVVGGLLGGPAGAVAGGVATSYPGNLGDILENQRDQTENAPGGPRTDLTSAGLLALPYTFVDNLTGIGGKITRGLTRTAKAVERPAAKESINFLERGLNNIDDFKGGAARVGYSVAKDGAIEGAGETFQETMNQLGRMAVDPNASLLSEDAQKRYLDSFVGGGVLGGLLGGAGNRGKRFGLKPTEAAPADSNVEAATPPYNLDFRERMRELNIQPTGPISGIGDVGRLFEAQAPISGGLQRQEEEQGAQNMRERDQRISAIGQQFQDLGIREDTGLVPQRLREQTSSPVQRQAGILEEQEQRQRAQAIKDHADQVAADVKSRQERMSALGLTAKGTSVYDAFKELEDAHADGAINDITLAENLGLLKAGQTGSVRKFIKGVYAQQDATAAADAQSRADNLSALQKAPDAKSTVSSAPNVASGPAAGAATTTTPASAAPAQPSAPVNPTPAAPASAVANVSPTNGAPAVAAGPAAGVRPSGAVKPVTPIATPAVRAVEALKAMGIAPDREVEVVRAGKPVKVTALALWTGLLGNPLALKRAQLALGVDSDFNAVSSPMPFAAIAESEGVSRQAVTKQLLGFGINEAAVDSAIATDSGLKSRPGVALEEEADNSGVTAVPKESDNVVEQAAPAAEAKDDAGDTDFTGGSGFRIETTPAKAMGEGLVQGRAETRAQREARFKADELLKINKDLDNAVAAKSAEDTRQELENKRKAEAETEREFAVILADPVAANAEADWNDTKQAGTPEFKDMSPGERAELVYVYKEAVDAYMGDWNQIEPVLVKFEKEINYERSRNETDTRAASGGDNTRVSSGTGESPPSDSQTASRTPSPAPVVTTKKRRTIERSDAPNSRGTSDAKQLAAEFAKFLRVGALGRAVTVVQSASDLPFAPGVAQSMGVNARTQGFVLDGKAYFIADNIAPGKGKAVFMHEVGSHLGLQNQLSTGEFKKLVDTVTDWASGKAGPAAQKIAQAAMARVSAAQTEAAQYNTELVAYTIEEAMLAGYNPAAAGNEGPIKAWMRAVVAQVKALLSKLGMNPDKFGVQDLVDLAYGAAQAVQAVDTQEAGRDNKATTGANDGLYSASVAKRSGFTARVARYEQDFSDRLRQANHTAETRAHSFRNAGDFGATKGYFGFVVKDGVGNAHAFVVAPVLMPQVSDLLARLDAAGASEGKHISALAEFALQHATFDANAKTVGTVGPRQGSVSFNHHNNLGQLKDTGLKYFDGQPIWQVKDVSREQTAQLLGMLSAFHKATGGEGGDVTWERVSGAKLGKTGKASFSVSGPSMPTTPQGKAITKAHTRMSESWLDMTDGFNWTLKRAVFTKDLVALAVKGGLSSASSYFSNMNAITVEKLKSERAVSDVLEAFRRLPAREQGVGAGTVNALVQASTTKKSWAYQPTWLGPVAVDKGLNDQYMLLSEDARKVVDGVFKHGNDNRVELLKAAGQDIDAQFAEDLAAAKTPEAQAAIEKEKKQALTATTEGLAGTWPYAPLGRYGNYVVLAMSAKYLEAHKNKDTKAMQAMQSDEAHYRVERVDTMRAARRLRDKLDSDFPGGLVDNFEKPPEDSLVYGGRDALGTLRRLRNLIKDSAEEDGGVGKGASAALNRMMRDLHLTLLAETSARKSQVTRKTVAGANADMMRSFAGQGRAMAHYIAALKTDGKVQDTLQAMKNQARESVPGRAERQAYYNEILRRHVQQLDYQPSPAIDKAMSVTSIWMLLTNPAHQLMNLMQPAMMSHPLLAGKHGYGRSGAAMVRAYRDLGPMLKAGGLTEKNYATLPKDVRAAIEELANRGVIDVSLAQDLGEFQSNNGGAGEVFGKVVKKLRDVSENVEAVNRLSTAMSAYRLEKERGATDAAAIDYAAKVIYETHGDYSSFNAPRYMRQGVFRLATQFRKFQLIQISMYARLLNDSFKGATPEERLIARKALAFNLAHLLATGGVMALPGFAAVSWLLTKAFGDDDEPDDVEAKLRRALDDKGLADLLLRGAPKFAGVDVSDRIGAGGMLSLLPYADGGLDRKGYEAIVMQALGPFVGGLMPRAVDGVGLMAQSMRNGQAIDFYKGMELLLPNGVGNLMKAARYQTDGISQRNGDVVLPAEDLGFLDSFGQALGLPSNAVTDRNFLNQSKRTADEFYKQRTSDIKREYVGAFRDNDADVLRQTREEWMTLQQGRQRLGYEVQPLSVLLKAPQEVRKREQNAVSGVEVNKRNKGFVDALAE